MSPNYYKQNRNLQNSELSKKFFFFYKYHVRNKLCFHANYLVFTETKSHENKECFRSKQSWLIWAEEREFSESRAEKFTALSMSLRGHLNSTVVAFFHFRYLINIKWGSVGLSFFVSKK